MHIYNFDPTELFEKFGSIDFNTRKVFSPVYYLGELKLDIVGFALFYNQSFSTPFTAEHITNLFEAKLQHTPAPWPADIFYCYLVSGIVDQLDITPQNAHIDFLLKHTDVNKNIEAFPIGTRAFLAHSILSKDQSDTLFEKTDFSKEIIKGTSKNTLGVVLSSISPHLSAWQLDHIVKNSCLATNDKTRDPQSNTHLFLEVLPQISYNQNKLSFEQINYIFEDMNLDFQTLEAQTNDFEKIFLMAEHIGRKNAFRAFKDPKAHPNAKMILTTHMNNAVKGYNWFKERKLALLKVQKEKQVIEHSLLGATEIKYTQQKTKI